MKHLIPSTILAACVLAASTAGAEPWHRAEIKDITVKFVDTPRFRLIDTPDRSQDRSPLQWLEIEAEVAVDTLHKSEFIPELTASWHVIVKEPDFENKIAGKKQQSVRLTGEFTFLDIRADNETAWLVAYVHPNTLARITGSKHPGERDIVAVALELSGPNIVTAGESGKGLTKATAEPDGKKMWWDNWTLRTYKDLVSPKHQTPFAPLWTDRHPAVKRK